MRFEYEIGKIFHAEQAVRDPLRAKGHYGMRDASMKVADKVGNVNELLAEALHSVRSGSPKRSGNPSILLNNVIYFHRQPRAIKEARQSKHP